MLLYSAEEIREVKLGRPIEAIKLYRKREGCDLWDAKEAIDRLRCSLGELKMIFRKDSNPFADRYTREFVAADYACCTNEIEAK